LAQLSEESVRDVVTAGDREMNSQRKVDLRGVWILPLMLVSHWFVTLGPGPGLVESALHLPQDGNSAASYLAKYVARGIGAGLALLLISAASCLIWRRSTTWVGIALVGAWCALTPPFVGAVMILWRCFVLTESSQAEIVVHDFTGPIMDFAVCTGLISGVFVFLCVSFALWRESRKRESVEASPGT
jgi:hypothetical protein